MTPCLVPGCVVRGQHVPDCPDHCQHWPNPCPIARRSGSGCDGHCSGCLPREAFDPWVVCRWHGVRFADTLDSLAPQIAHLHEIGKPFAQSAPLGDEGHGTPEGYANIDAAVLAADELERDVEWIARAVLDDAWPVLRRRVSWPRRSPWDGNAIAWLIDHADTALSLPSAVDYVAALIHDAETARHRWPSADDMRPALVLDLPCPRCGMRSLVRRPVMWQGQAERIDCSSPDCARIFTREEYDRFAEVALRDGKMGKWKTGAE